MKFCNSCGRQLEDQARFCDACGSTQHYFPAREQPALTAGPTLRPAEFPPSPTAPEPYLPPSESYAPYTPAAELSPPPPKKEPLALPPILSKIHDIPVAWKALLLFAIAICARIIFLEVVGFGYTGWYVDSYHHWQIAFYTLHVGFAQNPPRLWDLSGQEYFWGPLPTLTESLLLYLFNSTTLTPFRIFDTVMGGGSVVLIYFLGRRFFDDGVGLVAGVATALSPVLWEVDTSGMLDPMGITLLLLALLLFRRKNYWTGFVLGLASLVHIEFWFLSLALIAFYLVFEGSSTEFVAALTGWLTVMVPYFYVLQTETGDFLYPLRYNLFSSVGGAGIQGVNVPFQAQIIPRAIFVIMLLMAVVFVIGLLIQKPASYPFHGFFLSRVAMHGIIFGLTPYIIPYIAFGQIPRVLIDRLFALEYYYIPFVVAAILAHVHNTFQEKNQFFDKALTYNTPNMKRVQTPPSQTRGRLVGMLMILLLFNVSLVPLVAYEYYTTYGSYQYQLQMADYITSHYVGGTVISADVLVTYRLINNGFPLQNILGSVYCPKGGGIEAYTWLHLHNVTWVLLDDNLKQCFPALKENNTSPFHLVWGTNVYTIDQQELLRLTQG